MAYNNRILEPGLNTNSASATITARDKVITRLAPDIQEDRLIILNEALVMGFAMQFGTILPSGQVVPDVLMCTADQLCLFAMSVAKSAMIQQQEYDLANWPQGGGHG